ncbi:MAG TPA: hypothetical protein VNP92_02865 [Actinophytocola sp.]|nr:hypothetical protein [Actinophytocola sp.]
MELTRFVDSLGRELAVAAESAGAEGRELAERLVTQLTSAIQLTLLEALSVAADEITRELVPGSVEIRLRGLDPTFVVTPPPADQAYDDEDDGDSRIEVAPSLADMAPANTNGEGSATSRINFRPPEYLKARVEEAAARERLSVNAWLVRAISATLESEDRDRRPERRAPRRRTPGRAERYVGWVK